MRRVWVCAFLVLLPSACAGPDTHDVDTMKPPSRAASTDDSQPMASPTTSPDPAGASLEVTISGEDVRSEVQGLSMTVGGPLRVTVKSDRGGALHFQPNHVRSIDFTAGLTGQILVMESAGVMEIEEHVSGIVVTQLAVNDPATPAS